MALKPFCRNCKHRRIPKSIKHKFNSEVEEMFDECPSIDPNVIGCLVATINIDWKSFSKWLGDNGLIDEEEEIELKKLKI